MTRTTVAEDTQQQAAAAKAAGKHRKDAAKAKVEAKPTNSTWDGERNIARTSSSQHRIQRKRARKRPRRKEWRQRQRQRGKSLSGGQWSREELVIRESICLLRGANRQDRLMLRNVEKFPACVYEFDPCTNSVCPDERLIPWDVAFLGKYHRKHRFASAAPPRLEDSEEDGRGGGGITTVPTVSKGFDI